MATSPLGKFLRFATLSGLGWLLDAALLLTLVSLAGSPPLIANIVSSCTAATTVFLLSREKIFDKAPQATGLRVIGYMAYSLCVILVASGLLGLLVRQLTLLDLCRGWSTAAIAGLAKVIVTPPQLLLNFLVSRHLSERRLSNAVAP